MGGLLGERKRTRFLRWVGSGGRALKKNLLLTGRTVQSFPFSLNGWAAGRRGANNH
jgi:hypothetical protein